MWKKNIEICKRHFTVTERLAESNGSLPPGEWLKDTCELTTCTRDQLREQCSEMRMGKLYLLSFYQGQNFIHGTNDSRYKLVKMCIITVKTTQSALICGDVHISTYVSEKWMWVNFAPAKPNPLCMYPSWPNPTNSCSVGSFCTTDASVSKWKTALRHQSQ